jgi:hypothetical protein
MNYFAVLVFIFVFGIINLIAMLMMNKFVEGFTNAGYNASNIMSVAGKYTGILRGFDLITVLMLAVLVIGVALTSFRVATSAAFFIISVIFSAFLGLMGYFFSYTFQQIASNAVFTTVTVFYPRTILIARNLHWVGLIVFVVGSISLYAKKEKGQFVE